MNALIVGRRRMGKSTLSLSIAVASQQMMNRIQNPTVIIFDPNNQFRGFFTTADIGMVEHFMELSMLPGSVPNVLVFRPRAGFFDVDFEALVDVLWAWDEYSLVIDEASVLQKPSWIHPSLEKMIRQSPSGVSVIQATHRLVDIHRLVRSQVTDTFLFWTDQSGDLKLIADEYSPMIASLVSSLKRHEVIHYWLDPFVGKSRFAIWDNPDTWNVNIGNDNAIRMEQKSA